MAGPCLLALLLLSPVAGAACPPAGHDATALRALTENGFAVADAGERRRLALALPDCLGAPDPALRDGVAHAPRHPPGTWRGRTYQTLSAT